MLDSLAVVGLVAIVATGELDGRALWLLLGALVAALAAPSALREKRAVQVAGTVVSVGALLVQLARLSTSANIVTLVLEFAAVLQVVRLATRRGAAHDQQIIILAFLHLIAATILGAGLAYAACFVGFLFLAPVTLLLSHLRREVEGNYRQGARDRAGLPVDVPRILRSRRVVSSTYLGLVVCLSLPMVLFTGILFVAFPRVGLSLLLLQPPKKARLVGFSDRVDLGVVGKLHADPSVALRITYHDLPAQPPEHLAVYLRGATLDYYDGASWSKTQTGVRAVDREGALLLLTPWPVLDAARSMTIELSPIDPPIVFLPTDSAAFQLLPQAQGEAPESIGLFRNSDDEYRYVADSASGLRYRVYIQDSNHNAPPVLTPSERIRYLSWPRRLSNRVEQLAKSWVGNESDPLVQSKLIENHLRHDYKYDLESPSGSALNPLEDFLFSSRRGHCEYYATAMAIMLRALGTPSRNVTGFGAASFNRFGRFYVVRQSDAHSWVEAWFEGIGWRRFDPTPPLATTQQNELGGMSRLVRDLVEAAAQRWSRHVEAYDIHEQLRLAWKLREHTEHLRIPRWARAWGTPRNLGLAGLITLIALRLAKYWRKRRAQRVPKGPDLVLLSVPSKVAVQLYQNLEEILSELGVPRPVGSPPWGHAQSLVVTGHPRAEQILALTRFYLEARFGNRIIAASDIEMFKRELAFLRQYGASSRAA